MKKSLFPSFVGRCPLEGYVYLGSLSLITLISATLSRACWQKRQAQGAIWLTALFTSIAFWTLLQAVCLLASSISHKIALHNVMFIGICIVPVAMFCFVLDYYHLLQHYGGPFKFLIFAVPLLNIVMVLTDPWHHFFFTGYTLAPVGSLTFVRGGLNYWFWFHSAFSYTLILGALLVLLYQWFHETGAYRRLTFQLIVGILLSSFINLLTIMNVFPAAVDLTPISFIIVGSAFYYSMYYTHVFELGPVTKDLVYESIQDGLAITDKDGLVLEHNTAFGKLFNPPIENATGRDFEQLIGRLGFSLPNAASEPASTIRLNNSTNATATYLISHNALKDRHQRPTGTLYVFKDITETERSIEAANHAHHAAAIAKDSITRALSDTSHEIRTPLMGITGAAHQLLTGAKTPEHSRFATEIISGSEALLATVNRVLDYSKLEAGKLHAIDDFLPLAAHLEHLESIKNPSYILTSDAIPAGVNLWGNRHHLYRILGLLHDFLSEGDAEDVCLNVAYDAPTLCHTLDFKLKNHEAITLMVHWEGIEDYLILPWHPDPLNLVLAKGLAAMDNNTLIAAHQEGHWRLALKMPFHIRGNTRDEAKNESAVPLNCKLLFAEDSAINQTVIKRMLKEMPWEIHFASDGNEALSLCKDVVFDIIFTDIHMPGLGGIELSYCLLDTINSKTPVFAFSSDSDKDIQTQIAMSPIRALIVKPCPKEELIRIIQDGFNNPNSISE